MDVEFWYGDSLEVKVYYFAFWSLIWIILLNIPPGSTSIDSSYRLNFSHGLLSTIVAIACLSSDLVPYGFTTFCTLSYFIIDFINIMFNDFYWKVPTYHSPTNRRIEYFHHIFCCTLGMLSEFTYKDFCTFEKNPFVLLMFAEFSTPFLIAWRVYGHDYLMALFVVAFFACRIAYHGLVLIPDCMRQCHWSVGYGFGIPYDLLNVFFFVSIIQKIIRDARKKNSTKMQ